MQIKKIIDMGILLEPAVAKELIAFSVQQETALITRLNELDAKPLVLDAQLVKRLMLVPPVVIKKVDVPKELSTMQLVKHWNEMYDVLRKILMKTPALSQTTSIVNAKGKCTVIGMVSVQPLAAMQSYFELEDPTGRVKLVSSKNTKLFNGDMVGVTGTLEEGVLRAQDIFFPGIQLQQAKKKDITIAVNMQADYTIRQPNITETIDCNGINVLVYNLNDTDKEKFGDSEELAREILKRRHFSPEPFGVVDTQPDIFFIVGAQNFSFEHKGIMVIGCTHGARINFETKNVEF